MEFLLGVGVTLYSLGLIGSLLLFCLEIGVEPRYAGIPFPIRLSGAILKAILWPISLPLMIFGHRS